jgi:hypothetical protein
MLSKHGWQIYDCGCVVGRPQNQHCKSYGTRWRAYLTTQFVILKCRDCGKYHKFHYDIVGGIKNG